MPALILRTGHFLKSMKSAISCHVRHRHAERALKTWKKENVSFVDLGHRKLTVSADCGCTRTCVCVVLNFVSSHPVLLTAVLEYIFLAVLIGAKHH